jgi:hypothetical protein
VAGTVAARAIGCALLIALGVSCGSASAPSQAADAPPTAEAGVKLTADDAASPDGDPAPSEDAAVGGSAADGSLGDAEAVPADRFVGGVVSFDPGPCAGFGASSMPQIVEGPPFGGGSDHGSTDVVSLGVGGAIVLSFGANAIVDGPGADFIVFENPFWVAGNSNDVYAEPGEVSVSDDGVTWHVFPCVLAADAQSAHGTGVDPPYGSCAGWHVVWSSPGNGISPIDPTMSGGDAFDLADLGVTHARYVRIVDKTNEACPDAGAKPDNDGFDLDGIAIVHAELP